MLRQFYYATGGDRWAYRGNWPASPAAWPAATLADAAGWTGVTVSGGDVAALNLAANGLVGTVPAGLGQLRALYLLSLQRNRLTGGIPPELGQLGGLQHLNLFYNQLTGPIPAALGQLGSLLYCNLFGNQLSGAIPPELGQLHQVRDLNLFDNQLTGTVPAALGQLRNVQYVNLQNNRLSGPLRPAFGSVPPLRQLALFGNCFDFAQLEPLFTGPGRSPRAPAFAYAPQLAPAGTDTLRYAAGDPLRLAHGFGGTRTRYQWQRRVAGTWQDLAGARDSVLAVPSASAADSGAYRATATNEWVTGLTLTSKPVYAQLQGGCPPLALRVSPDVRLALGDAVTLRAYPGGPDVRVAWSPAAGLRAPAGLAVTAAPATTTTYTATATDSCGATATAAVTVTVTPPPPLANPPVDGCAPALANAAPPSRAGAGDVVNFVRTYAPRVALTDTAAVRAGPQEQVQVTTAYLDGLGRPVQTVRHRASPLGRDLVTPVAYDALGRQPRQYLPYAAATPAGAPGAYRPDAVFDQYAFYRQDPAATPAGPGNASDDVAPTGVAYGETAFEASPLNRVVAQGAPGETWALGGGHVTGRVERPNTDADAVARFAAAYGTGAADAHALAYQGTYAAGELWTVETTDEQGQAVQAFTDKLGQVVAKKVALAPGQWLTTGYVYDDFNHLRAVLPPKATRLLAANNQQVTPAVDSLLFYYRYDGRGRPLAKQVPGQSGEAVTVFDQLDRPVLAQDPAQRARNEWAWTKYDALGRAVLTGLVARAATADQLQQEADRLGTAPDGQAPAVAQFEQPTPDAATQYYSVTGSYPRLGQDGFGAGQVLTAAYYDGYDFNQDGTPDAAFDDQYAGQFPAGAAPAADGRVTGLATRTRTRVLGAADNDPRQAAWLTATTFYDEQARPVQVVATNARGGQDVVTSQLDFTGQVLKTYSVHTDPRHEAIAVAETHAYDHAGRLLTTAQQLLGEARPATVASLAYNEIGQLVQHTLAPGTGLAQRVDRAYNARGWLVGLNADLVTGATPAAASPDLWGMTLSYDCGFQVPQYNGNIAGQQWRGKRDGVARAYGYGYDGANRLRYGDYVARGAAGSWDAEQQRYGLGGVRYDANGNVLALQRRGLLAPATRALPKRYGPVDELTYAYAGNRLQAVNDAVQGNELPRAKGYAGAPASLAGDFQEQGVQRAQEYGYDPNGSLTSDANKGITGILYNHLSLPRQIHFGAGADSVVFRYAASGQKVAKLVYQTGKPLLRTDYLGPYQYEQDSLRFFPHAEGRVLRFVNALSGAVRYEREYTIKDHLGNLRLAYRAGRRATYAATLEPDDNTRQRETHQFDSLSVSPPVAQNVGIGARTGAYAARLNAGGPTPQPLGPLTQLSVQKGDTVTVTAPGYYPQKVQGSGFAFSLASFVAGLLQPPPGGPAPGYDGRRRGALPLLSIGVSATLPALLRLGGGVPQGYARLLVFDADSNLVSSQTRQLSAAAGGGYEPLTVQAIVGQDGYVTAYVGNESPADVYFDDVTVTLGQGLQVQETEYDPAGLELAGLAPPSPGIKGLNNYRFNGKEFQVDLGLNWNHQDWRFFDPQLLRWHAVDPEVENGQQAWTPYSFGYDNALRYADANGREPGDGDGFWNRAGDFATGVRDAFLANNTTLSLPTGSYSLVNSTAIPSPSYAAGQTAGNLISLAQGVAELVVGGNAAAGGAAGGALTAPTVVGGAAGLAVVATGVAVAAHGYSTASNAARNLLGDNNGRVNANSSSKGTYSHPDSQHPLARDGRTNEPAPDVEAKGNPHTQLGRKAGRNGDYNQAREFGSDGKPVKDIDFTDHGRPSQHPNNPHQHSYRPNPTGGNLQRGKSDEPLQ